MEIKSPYPNLPIPVQERHPAQAREREALRFDTPKSLTKPAQTEASEYISRGEWITESRQDYRNTLNRLRATRTYEGIQGETGPLTARQHKAVAAYRENARESLIPSRQSRFDDYA